MWSLGFERLDLKSDPVAHKPCVLWFGLFEPQFVHMQHSGDSASFVETGPGGNVCVAPSPMLGLEEHKVGPPLGIEQGA